MALEAAQLRITAPTGPNIPGRGFYQVEEDRLFVQIGLFAPDRRFFSYLDTARVKLDFDRNARLIFIEVNEPRRRWPIDTELRLPKRAEPADARFLGFRDTLPPTHLTATDNHATLRLSFSAEPITRTIQLARNVVLQADSHNRLTALWIGGIVDDHGGRKLAAYRKRCLRLAR
ncbi:MAG TPA: hypothetical protein PLF13_12010 [candidate division Zixibacteria bacterium]|nr:hypothetical protein [candidate division Zixibacteria bacterium]